MIYLIALFAHHLNLSSYIPEKMLGFIPSTPLSLYSIPVVYFTLKVLFQFDTMISDVGVLSQRVIQVTFSMGILFGSVV
jgi:hypothetical protein